MVNEDYTYFELTARDEEWYTKKEYNLKWYQILYL